MFINKIRLYNYRNFSDKELFFKKGINVLYGNNGAGKTNILEAINYISQFSSFKSSNRKDVIKLGNKYSFIQLEIFQNKIFQNEKFINAAEISADAEIRTDGELEKTRINEKTVSKKSLKELYRTVVYQPQTANIIYNSAGNLRNFLDKELININNNLEEDFKKLKICLYQRGLILKAFDFQKNPSEEILQQFTNQLTELSAKISIGRLLFLKNLLPSINKIFCFLSGLKNKATQKEPNITNNDLEENFSNINISINYISRYMPNLKLDSSQISNEKKDLFINQAKQNLRECFMKVLLNEKKIGQNLIGAHRDKIIFTINYQPIEKILSTGQMQIFCLSLILAISDMKTNDQQNILLLDDVLAQIDERTKYRLFYFLKNKEQVFLTSTNEVSMNYDVAKKLLSGGFLKENGLNKKVFKEIMEDKIYNYEIK
ncbi:MAG: DNA replication and repair protein RecF [Bifidobacteriaceae bacterium]|jgi:DNA replication and repair protein RecF|nr:DNA replication and repair protein RecF [Bifidobacteriaceae bacterium]